MSFLLSPGEGQPQVPGGKQSPTDTLLPSLQPRGPSPRFAFWKPGGTWMGTHGRPGRGLGTCPTSGHLLPARTEQPGASQADTMGRTHVRFLGEENYSLWTERSGQDIYNCLKKSPVCSPLPLQALPKCSATLPAL